MNEPPNVLTAPPDQPDQPDQPGPPPPPPSDPPGSPRPGSRRLTRRTDQKVVAGVCAGLGEHFDIDPVLFRVAFVVLALLGGAGVLLYILLWILLPPESGPGSPGSPAISERAAKRSRAGGTWLGIAILVAGGILLIGDLGAHRPFPWVIRPGIVWGVALVLLGILLYQRGERRKGSAGASGHHAVSSPPASAPLPDTAIPAMSMPASAAWSEQPAGTDLTAPIPPAPTDVIQPDAPSTYVSPWDTSPTSPPAEPVAVAYAEQPGGRGRTKARSALGWMTLGVALLAVGVAALLDQWTSVDMTVGRYLALFLLVMGGGLVVGAWIGRARWLIVLGILLLPFVLAASLISVPLTGGTGARTIRPATVGEIQPAYRLAAGQLRIELTSTDLAGQSVPVVASVALGRLVVVVPDTVTVVIHAKVGAGTVQVFSEPPDPLDREVDGVNATLDQTYEGSGSEGTITLDLAVGYGVVNVYRNAPPSLG
jgi:phage shock protein PspC (stress-responsive transcriptional regulator)